MKTTLTIISSSLALSAMSASAAVLTAGWDFFDSSTNPTATQVATDTTADLTSSASSGNWGRWNGTASEDAGASTDGTFGSLSTSVASASMANGGNNSGSNLSLGRNNKPGSLVITLTNDSGADRQFDAFYFDSVGRFAQSAKDWDLTFSGAISGTAASGTLTQAQMMSASAAQRDWAVDLTGLTDNNWEAGTNAVFTLNFSGGDPSNNPGTNGGHETLVDNIGITVVPEPSATLLGALGALALLIRRRR